MLVHLQVVIGVGLHGTQLVLQLADAEFQIDHGSTAAMHGVLIGQALLQLAKENSRSPLALILAVTWSCFARSLLASSDMRSWFLNPRHSTRPAL